MAKGCSLDVRKQMIQRVVGRPRVRGVGAIMVRQNKAFLDHVLFFFFFKASATVGTSVPRSMSHFVSRLVRQLGEVSLKKRENLGKIPD